MESNTTDIKDSKDAHVKKVQLQPYTALAESPMDAVGGKGPATGGMGRAAPDGLATSKQPTVRAASLLDTFQCATPADVMLMILGTLGGIVTGGSLPIFNVLFGELLDELNEDPATFRSAVEDLCMLLVIIAAINLVSSFLQVSCWACSGERQTQIFRERYVNAILSQEIGWFDTCGAGELATKVTELTGRVQDGLGRKVGDLIQYAVQVVFSLAVAFYINWELTLILLGTLPLIAASGKLE